jgi:structural maintenance of chromosome 4
MSSSSSSFSPPRLMILKMVCENFKSYGGVKEIGPFHKSFSSVVGPNGSGKSNVIDAMLFVFGKKSAKLRMNKLSELIHKSSEYPDLEYARVTVFFQEIIEESTTVDDGDGYTVIPGSQFTMTRTVNRANVSEYYISGKKAPVAEVVSLLKGKGIDLDNNRFLILQGEVELISQMKPKAQSAHEEGLLEYLEDIIGSNALVEQISTASLLLEQLSEQRNEKIKRVQLAERERASLEGSKAEAEAFLTKEREIKRKQGLLFQKHFGDASQGAASTESLLADATAKVEAERAALKTLTEAISVIEKKLSEATKVHSADSEKLASQKRAMSDVEQQDVKLREDLKVHRLSQKTNEEALKREQTRLEEAQKTIQKTSSALPALHDAVTRLEAERAKEAIDHDAVMSSLKGETETLRKQLDLKQAELTPAADAAAAAASVLRTAKTELSLTRDTVNALSNNVASVKAKASQIATELSGKSSQKASAQAELESAMSRRSTIDKELDGAKKQEAIVAERVKVSRSKLDEGKASLASEGSRGSPIMAQLMAAAKKGGPLANAGLHGRLGDLGKIDDAYDVAVTTACPALNWLVVETTEGGQACVDFLRAKNLGRAKFIILDKMTWANDLSSKPPPNAPEGVPRLFDLIQTKDPKFRAAFYFALRDTVVAKDLDQATRVAYNGATRWRTVTLGGEMVEVNGAMSGGGKQVRRGGMSSTFAPELTAAELAAFEQEAEKAAAALNEIRSKIASLSKEVLELERSIPKISQRITKIDMETAALLKIKEDVDSQITAASAAHAASGGASAADAKQIADLEKKVAQLEAASASANVASSKLEGDVVSLKRQVVEMGGERVARAKARLQRVDEALAKAMKDVTTAKSDHKAAEKAAERASALSEKAITDAKAAVAEYEKTKAKLKPLEDEALVILKNIETAKAAVAASEVAVVALRGEVEESSQNLKIAKAREQELSLICDDLKQRANAYKQKAQSFKKQLDKVSAEYKEAMEELVADVSSVLAEEGGPEEDVSASSEAAAEAQRSRVLAKINEPLTVPIFSAQELASVSVDAVQSALAVLEAEIKELSKKANMSAIVEFRAKEKDYLRRVNELESVAKAREIARRDFESVRKKRLDMFMAGFSVITLRLKEMYQMITLGGDAELELVDSLDPFAEGIVFSVRPPKKSWKNISNLSGGEKTLSSLALVFALHHYKPTPLYVMDEIDAALDFKNVSIVANYIKERTKNAQFIIISLRNNMFELADRLVGIYKTKDVTKSVTINPKIIAAATGASSGGAAGPVGAEAGI